MSLSQLQLDQVATFLNPQIENLHRCASKALVLQALRLILKPSNLNIVELENLSARQSNRVPLLPSVVSIRSLQRNPTQIPGIDKENADEVKEYVIQKVNASIKSLNSEKIDPEVVTKATVEGAAAFVSCMGGYLSDALQAVSLAMNAVMHSDNKMIHYAVTYALKGAAIGLMKDGNILGPEAYSGAVAGAIGGAIGGVVNNIRGDVRNIAYMVAIRGVVKGLAPLTGISDMPDIAEAAAASFGAKGEVVSALYDTIQKNIYNIMYRKMHGGEVLEGREINKFMDVYCASTGISKLSKEVISSVGDAVSTRVSSKGVNIATAAVLATAVNEARKYILKPKTLNTEFTLIRKKEEKYMGRS